MARLFLKRKKPGELPENFEEPNLFALPRLPPLLAPSALLFDDYDRLLLCSDYDRFLLCSRWLLRIFHFLFHRFARVYYARFKVLDLQVQ